LIKSQFHIEENKIKYIGKHEWWHQKLINKVIPKDKIYRFTLKIVNTKHSQILLGIADWLEERNNFN
jgi:hypothetical protein